FRQQAIGGASNALPYCLRQHCFPGVPRVVLASNHLEDRHVWIDLDRLPDHISLLGSLRLDSAIMQPAANILHRFQTPLNVVPVERLAIPHAELARLQNGTVKRLAELHLGCRLIRWPIRVDMQMPVAKRRDSEILHGALGQSRRREVFAGRHRALLRDCTHASFLTNRSHFPQPMQWPRSLWHNSSQPHLHAPSFTIVPTICVSPLMRE